MRSHRGQVLIKDGDAVVDIAKCDAATLRRVRRLRIAMVFQQFGLLPWRSVRDNVGFGLELRGEPAASRKRIIDEQLELVGLSQWADRHVSELSGGMQQRVGLARAFATNADVLLMDEPFSALDPLIRGKLQDELLALQARVKKTILFVSHDLDEALKLETTSPFSKAAESFKPAPRRTSSFGRERLRRRIRDAHESAQCVDRIDGHAPQYDDLRGGADSVAGRRAPLPGAH